MASQQTEVKCEYDNKVNTPCEQKKEEVRKNTECEQPKPTAPAVVVEECPRKLSECCTLPPTTHIPLVEINTCKKCPNDLPCCTTIADPGCLNTKCPKDILCTSALCPCKKTKCPNLTFCTTINNECENFDLTPYGKEFAANTGKMIKDCLCVKFNGLQDSCKHPNCCTRIGCFDIPFPTCPPARKWKMDFICKFQKRPTEC